MNAAEITRRTAAISCLKESVVRLTDRFSLPGRALVEIVKTIDFAIQLRLACRIIRRCRRQNGPGSSERERSNV